MRIILKTLYRVKHSTQPYFDVALAVALNDAVYAAERTFPFPQREVILLRGPEAGSWPPSAAGGPQSPK
jgi:hypothetical protein